MSLNPRILVIDDEPDVTEYFCTLLSEHGFDTSSANSADEGLEKLAAARPDVILLDLLMPLKTGINLFNKIRKDDRYGDIPIIIVSGIQEKFSKDYDSFFKELKKGRPYAFLEKPVKPDQLVDMVREAMGFSRQP